MYRSILVAVDGSEANRLAVDTAIDIAKMQGASLTAICVFDLGSYSTFKYGMTVDMPYMQEMIDDALKYVNEASAAAGIKVETISKLGKPADCIIEEAKNHNLLVCGTHGRTGFSRALLGSVAERVVRMAPCPVLVVRQQS